MVVKRWLKPQRGRQIQQQRTGLCHIANIRPAGIAVGAVLPFAMASVSVASNRHPNHIAVDIGGREIKDSADQRTSRVSVLIYRSKVAISQRRCIVYRV